MTTTVDDADSQTFEAVVRLYVACSKLPDGDLSDAEAARIVELTRVHTGGLSPAYGDRVVRDVAASLAALDDVQARLGSVVSAAERVAEQLSVQAKQGLVSELQSIIEADGVQTSQEQDFVAAVAKTLGVDG